MTGPTGPSGPTGPQGTPGGGTVMWASNNGNTNANQCLAVAVDDAASQNCPAAGQVNNALSHSGVTWGPANASMTVTKLFAFSGDIINTGSGATIQVLDNGNSASPLLSCTVTGDGATGDRCSSSATASVNQGDFLTVQLVSPPTGTFAAVAWRVSISLQ